MVVNETVSQVYMVLRRWSVIFTDSLCVSGQAEFFNTPIIDMTCGEKNERDHSGPERMGVASLEMVYEKKGKVEDQQVHAGNMDQGKTPLHSLILTIPVGWVGY
ncbi:hypothetical protein [Nitrospira sp. Ecomares 2.1]